MCVHKRKWRISEMPTLCNKMSKNQRFFWILRLNVTTKCNAGWVIWEVMKIFSRKKMRTNYSLYNLHEKWHEAYSGWKEPVLQYFVVINPKMDLLNNFWISTIHETQLTIPGKWFFFSLVSIPTNYYFVVVFVSKCLLSDK